MLAIAMKKNSKNRKSGHYNDVYLWLFHREEERREKHQLEMGSMVPPNMYKFDREVLTREQHQAIKEHVQNCSDCEQNLAAIKLEDVQSAVSEQELDDFWVQVNQRLKNKPEV